MAFSGTVSNPALPTDVGNVGCVALSENFLLRIQRVLFRLGYIPYIPYIVFFFYEKEGVLITPPPRRYTNWFVPVQNQNRQVYSLHISILGQAHIRYGHSPHTTHPPRYRRPNRRPNYACCRNQNETVALFCKVNAKRWCLLVEPSPLLGTKIHPKAL